MKIKACGTSLCRGKWHVWTKSNRRTGRARLIKLKSRTFWGDLSLEYQFGLRFWVERQEVIYNTRSFCYVDHESWTLRQNWLIDFSSRGMQLSQICQFFYKKCRYWTNLIHLDLQAFIFGWRPCYSLTFESLRKKCRSKMSLNFFYVKRLLF